MKVIVLSTTTNVSYNNCIEYNCYSPSNIILLRSSAVEMEPIKIYASLKCLQL